MTKPISAQSLPDLIMSLQRHVSEDMKADDITACELVEQLEFAWCCAERWRLEQCDPDLLEVGPQLAAGAR